MNDPQIISVVGARPQFVKAAIVSKAARQAGISESVIHTGQHYDEAMSDGLISELGISNIVQNFGVGSGSHAVQTAAIMTKFDEYLDLHPQVKCVMVYGDTNSTLAAGVVAAKRRLPIVHVEAGLRSFNREMPEEINRVMVDHLSEILFCSSTQGVENLRNEGIHRGVHMVGDVMLDAFNHYSTLSLQSMPAKSILDQVGNRPLALVTLHRPSNTDNNERFERIVAAIGKLDLVCLWPVHPRIKKQADRLSREDNIIVCPPLSYLQILHVLRECRVVLTDSGGLQKEAYWAKRPCLTLRDETEWTETIERGWNQLVEMKSPDDLPNAIHQTPAVDSWQPLYGDGTSTQQIAKVLAGLVRI